MSKQIELRTALEAAWAQRLRLWTEGNRLLSEGDRRRRVGDRLWAEMILSLVGNVTVEFHSRGPKKLPACEVGGVGVFEPITSQGPDAA